MNNILFMNVLHLVQEEFSLKTDFPLYYTNQSSRILRHAENILAISKKPSSPFIREAIKLASILSTSSSPKEILGRILPNTKESKKMINLTYKMWKISNSKRTNSQVINSIPEGEEYLLIPRLCNILELSGNSGLLQAWLFSEEKNIPFFTSSTYKLKEEGELEGIISDERFLTFSRRNKSNSMMDYLYDRILYLCQDENINYLSNPYLRSEMRKRKREIVKFLLEYGKTGSVNIYQLNELRAEEME